MNREAANGGTVLTDAGESAVLTCPGDGNDDFVSFVITNEGSNDNRLIITDADNMIIGLPDGLTANFEGAGTGVCRVWNLNFTGNFTAMMGDVITEAEQKRSAAARSPETDWRYQPAAGAARG